MAQLVRGTLLLELKRRIIYYIRIKKEDYTILCVYRFNEYKIKKSVFVDELGELLHGVKTSNLFVLGDINLDILSNNSDVDNYLITMASFGLKSLVNEPTRITTYTKTCIDHVFSRVSRKNNTSVTCSVLDHNITDHCTIAILLLVPGSKPNSIRKYIPFTTNKTINYKKLNNELKYEFWDLAYSEKEPSTAYNLFLNTLTSHITNCTSISSSSNKRLKRLQPWVSIDLLKRINKKNAIRKKLKRKPTDTALKDTYRKLCKEVEIDIKLARDKYYENLVKAASGNIKLEWKAVNKILNKRVDHNPITEIETDNNFIQGSVNIANCFNEYFTKGVIHDSNSTIRDICSCDDYNLLIQDPTCTNSFFFENITSLETHKMIQSLDNKNSCTSDDISNILLKKISLFVVDILTYIFNLSVSSGIFPQSMKSAEVIPKFKKGNPKLLNNYRPISILPTISKLFEKLMKIRFLKFLNRYNFFDDSQFGFRDGRSTEDALIKFCELIYGGLNDNKCTVGLFVDMTKAFDLVDHKILLRKLHLAGFRGNTYDWFKSYLTGRHQKVKLDNMFSKELEVISGVPQGSVLGPILFLTYINTIFTQNFYGNITAFADDLAFTYSTSSPLALASEINFDVHTMRQWFSKHKVQVSLKTKLINFKITGSSPSDPEITFHSTDCQKFSLSTLCCDNCFIENRLSLPCANSCFKIESVASIKYLGLTLDMNLSWKNHMNDLQNYLIAATRKIYRLKKFCSAKILLMIYYGIVHSKLQYGIVCWGGTYFNTLRSTLIKQKHIIRLIDGKNRLCSSWPLFCKLHILPLRHLYIYRVLKLFFVRSGNLSIRYSFRYNLRANNKLLVTVPSHNKKHFYNFYSVLAPTIYNALTQNIRDIRKLSTYLISIRDWLFQLDYPDVEDLLKVTT